MYMIYPDPITALALSFCLITSIPADVMWFDLWTIIHCLWGIWLSWLLPVVWMILSVSTWEILEAFTRGLGESEGV